MDDRKLGVALEAGDQTTSGIVEFGPPSVIVIAEIEHVGRSRLDRHGLGDGDVVDGLWRHRGHERGLAVGIVDDVQLGSAQSVREAGPIGAERTEPQHRRVDQIDRIGKLAPVPALEASHQFGQQSGEDFTGPLGIGVRKRRARNFASAKVIKPRCMAFEAGFHRPQAVRPGQLAIQQNRQLILRGQPTHVLVGPEPIHKAVHHAPRHQLQDRMKYCILMRHGAASFRVSNIGECSKRRRIHAMHPVQKN